jgi:hypothetical protein
MRIATYTRISTDEAHQPYSLEAQAVKLCFGAWKLASCAATPRGHSRLPQNGMKTG